MGRRLKRPTIKPLEKADGSVRSYLVTATVGGKQLKKVVPTLDAARALAAKWQGSRDASFSFLPTNLVVQELRASETWIQTCRSLGVTPEEANLWFARNYRKPGADSWDDIIEQYRQSRRDSHDLKPDEPDTPHIGNLVAAVKSFAASLKRTEVGTITIEEVETWLKTRGGRRQLLGDIRTFFRWCEIRGKISDNPAKTIFVRKVRKRKLPVVRRPERVAEDLALLQAEAPEWIPYYVTCLFAFIRPGTREGEAQRIDADIREGVQVVRSDGLLVSLGKNGAPRIVPWKCTGPLREWLMAYPMPKSFFPFQCNSGAKAERYWARWRKRLGLIKDELRHTGMTAAHYFGIERNELDLAADNDPGMRKRHYLGAWSPEDTVRLYSLRPSRSVRSEASA